MICLRSEGFGRVMHCMLCGAGHNIRLLLSLLRLFVAYLLNAMLAWLGQPIGQRSRQPQLAAA